MKVERWGMLRRQFVIHKYNWVERRLVFDQAREASKRTEPDSFNYFLELIFFFCRKRNTRQRQSNKFLENAGDGFFFRRWRKPLREWLF